MISQAGIGYVAGMIDGDGCLTLAKAIGKRRNIAIGIVVSSIDEDIVQKLRDITKVGNVNGPYTKGYYDGIKRQPNYKWSVTDQQNAAAIMMMIYPLMCSRRQERIRELLRIWKNTPRKPPNVKITKEIVLEIRRLRRLGTLTQQQIGNKFGLHQAHVSRIINNKKWGWVHE